MRSHEHDCELLGVVVEPWERCFHVNGVVVIATVVYEPQRRPPHTTGSRTDHDTTQQQMSAQADASSPTVRANAGASGSAQGGSSTPLSNAGSSSVKSSMRGSAPEFRPAAATPRTPPSASRLAAEVLLVIDFEATCEHHQSHPHQTPPASPTAYAQQQYGAGNSVSTAAPANYGGRNNARAGGNSPLVASVTGVAAEGAALTATAFIPEIIEFPVVAIDVATNGVVGEFHSFVRPTRNPVLSSFCRDLTGITQEQVDAAPPLREVLAAFAEWFALTFPQGTRAVLVTDGSHDVKEFVCRCSVFHDRIAFPALFFRWIDVKEAFSAYFQCGYGNISAMLDHLGLGPFEGRLHRGIDDARNIGRIVRELLGRGAHGVFRIQEIASPALSSVGVGVGVSVGVGGVVAPLALFRGPSPSSSIALPSPAKALFPSGPPSAAQQARDGQPPRFSQPDRRASTASETTPPAPSNSSGSPL